jgi:hypothetical protein
MSAGARFTAWFSDVERDALSKRAAEENTTVNWVVRTAVRKFLGKEALKEAAERVMDVAGNKS